MPQLDVLSDQPDLSLRMDLNKMIIQVLITTAKWVQ